MKNALIDLDDQLRSIGSRLTVLVGSPVEVLSEICLKYKVKRIWSNQETWNMRSYQRDLAVKSWSKNKNIEWVEKPKNGVIRNLDNRDNWSRKWYAQMQKALLPAPSKITSPKITSDFLPDPSTLNLNVNQKISVQIPTRHNAVKTLKSFLYSRGENYRYEMSSPTTAEGSCSRISPYLAFGQISVREAFQATKNRKLEIADSNDAFYRSLTSFASRLRWHCHFIQKLEDQPSIEINTLNSAFETIRPSYCDQTVLKAWESGMTGYPMVDACMRYLNETGWLNFRMRAMLVSFSSYHLWLDWRLIAKHLARQFLDYEPGIHYSQIQMQAGTTGMNSIRIYNPVKQGIDQDPDGKFIRQWVPELKAIPNKFVHQPWLLKDSNLNYPKPIVDEKLARTTAKEKIYSLKKQIKNSIETASLIQKHASRLNRRTKRKVKPKIPVNNQLKLDL